MKFNDKNKAIFNSDEKNEYKERQIIWWCTTLLCTLFPFIAQCISAIFSHKLDLISIINNGELVLLTYSLIIPTLIELIQLETKKNAKYVIYVLIWIFIILSDLLIYLSIKNSETYDNFIINLIFTILAMITSIIFSQKTIRYIFICSIDLRQEKEAIVEGHKYE